MTWRSSGRAGSARWSATGRRSSPITTRGTAGSVAACARWRAPRTARSRRSRTPSVASRSAYFGTPRRARTAGCSRSWSARRRSTGLQGDGRAERGKLVGRHRLPEQRLLRRELDGRALPCGRYFLGDRGLRERTDRRLDLALDLELEQRHLGLY